MAAHVLFPHARYFDFEDACHPRPASPCSAEAPARRSAQRKSTRRRPRTASWTPATEEKKGYRAGAPKRTFSDQKKRGRKMCNSKCRPGVLIFGRFSAPGRLGPFRAAATRGAETTARQTWTPGRLKRAAVNAGGVRAAVRADFLENVASPLSF